MAKRSDRWVSASQAAEILGVSHVTVARLAHDGKFPAWKPAGKELRMLRADVVQYLETTRLKSGAAK